jgi:hypothetical protein
VGQRGPSGAQFRKGGFVTKSFGTSPVWVPTSRGTRKGRDHAAHNKETFMVPWLDGCLLCRCAACSSAVTAVGIGQVAIQHDFFHRLLYQLMRLCCRIIGTAGGNSSDVYYGSLPF